MKPLLVVVCGPTASGKTELAIRIASEFGAEIISADSRQVYRELPIGSAAPTEEELLKVPHHLVGSVSIHQHYNAGRFANDARKILDELFLKNPIQVLAGGTGLYIKSLIDGIDVLPEVPDAIRNHINQRLETEGLNSLQEELKQRDPEYAKEVDLANKARVLRALELIETTGVKYSELRKGQRQENPFNVVYLMPELEREMLYRRINERAGKMLNGGWIEEAEALKEHRALKALQTLGYPEIFAMLEGKISKKDCLDQIQQATRRYAKRQLTWFRNQTNHTAVDANINSAEIRKICKIGF
ncbi:MAG: tRNA (adenosine(37)-N6)-dimethylallyltransferase MiaA [Bacteroidia bacterium]|jgi:tRNA dimethylallyltransferase